MSVYSTGILVNLKDKYNKINEIYEITKEMKEVFGRNDMYGLDMLADMRTDIIIAVDEIDQGRIEIIGSMEETERNKVLDAMKEDIASYSTNEEDLKKINELHVRIKKVLENIISLDKEINKRLNAGSSDNIY